MGRQGIILLAIVSCMLIAGAGYGFGVFHGHLKYRRGFQDGTAWEFVRSVRDHRRAYPGAQPASTVAERAATTTELPRYPATVEVIFDRAEASKQAGDLVIDRGGRHRGVA